MKTKILFLLSNFRSGGAETQYGNLIRKIDRDRFEPILGLIIYRDSIPSEDFLARFGDAKQVRFFRKGRFDPRIITGVAGFVRREKIHIIQSLLFMDNQIARLAGVLSRVPVITSIRGEIGPLLGPLKTRFEFLMQCLSDRIVVNSYWLGRYLEARGASKAKIVVIHNGIDYQRIECNTERDILLEKYQIRKDAAVVTIVARLHPMKDHITFLDAVHVIKQQGRNLHVLIVGDGKERQALEQYVSSLGLARSVQFMGDIGSSINEIYRISNILMLTSQWGESFPNVLLEAMYAGVPVVASNISAIGEIINDGVNGFLVEKKDASRFARSASILLDDRELAGRHVLAGKQTATRFSVPVMVRKYETMYSDLLESV